MNTEEQLIAATAQANRALGASGQSDMVWGHASIRDPDGRGAWMKAAGWSFEEVTDARVALVSPEGEVLAGAGVEVGAPSALPGANNGSSSGKRKRRRGARSGEGQRPE